MITAIGKKDRSIGRDNALIWHIPADLKRFKRLTMGHPVIMGRKTYESIPEKYRPLPGRQNIVITRQKDYRDEGIIVTHSIEDALEEAQKLDQDEIFIIGGQQIYKLGLSFAEKLHLTIIDTDKTGDTFFPEYEKEFTKETFRKEGESNGYKYTFLNLERA